MSTNDAESIRRSMVRETLTRAYPVTLPMVALILLVPGYIFIGGFLPGRTLHAPALAWDRALPLQPVWALVYGSLYLFLILLPVFLVRREEQVRRLYFAYLVVWMTAYVVFLVYPTVAPRPAEVTGQGFAAWGLRTLYAADPPYNCFPSIHVAHSFVSGLACSRLHRGVGMGALFCASLVALSTLLTKQHYLLDVIGGIVLAFGAWSLVLRRAPRSAVPESEHRVAPVIAAGTFGVVGAVLAGVWLAHRLGF